nr:extensin-2 [Arachis hypogaea]
MKTKLNVTYVLTKYHSTGNIGPASISMHNTMVLKTGPNRSVEPIKPKISNENGPPCKTYKRAYFPHTKHTDSAVKVTHTLPSHLITTTLLLSHHSPSNAVVTSHHHHSSPPPPPHSAAPPQPYPAAQYSTFQGVSNYPSPPRDPHPAIGFPHPVPPRGAADHSAPHPPYYLHGYQAVPAAESFSLICVENGSETSVDLLLKEDLYKNPALVAVVLVAAGACK